MTLSCTCHDDDGDYEWLLHSPSDYSTLNTNRRKRCKSCGTLIDIGAIVARFERNRRTRGDIEGRIYGEDGHPIPIAEWYHCEECADLYFSLTELGFCVHPEDDMRELVREYAKMTKEAKP
ncbi:MAG: hypothetical protein EOM22_08805 [Gammaproteobacteria bacterium]|nr:hypothetical protein [Gammaproteobacteria bacterium]